MPEIFFLFPVIDLLIYCGVCWFCLFAEFVGFVDPELNRNASPNTKFSLHDDRHQFMNVIVKSFVSKFLINLLISREYKSKSLSLPRMVGSNFRVRPQRN